MGFGLFAPILPRDDPEHRLHIREASPEVTLDEDNTKALIGYLQVIWRRVADPLMSVRESLRFLSLL